MNGTVSPDVVFLHAFDETGFAEIRWWLCFFLTYFNQGVELFRNIGLKGGIGPLNVWIYFEEVLLFDGQVCGLELLTANVDQSLVLISDSILRATSQEMPTDHIVYPPLIVPKSIFVHVLDRVDWGMCLIVGITCFGVLKLILIQQLANILAVLMVWPQTVNQAL